MMKKTSTLLLSLVLLARLAHAHSVPINPSVCAFEPLEVAAPSAGIETVASAATDADRFRIVYDPAPSVLQVCGADPTAPANSCVDPPARAFSGDGVDGTIDFSLFQGHITAAGDITVASAPLALTVGAQTASVAASFTTGLALADTTLAEGSAIAADGTFTLVGVATTSALPPPLGGTPLQIRMTCRAVPPPDLDQFTPPATTLSFGGTVKATGAKLKAAVEPGAVTPDFALPALARLSVAGTTIATLALPAGLTASGKKFTGRSADGLSTVTVRVQKRGQRLKLALQLPTPVLPTTAEKRIELQLTTQVGGLLSRATKTFRVGKRGLRTG